jgi:hypothetical protein
MTVAETVNPRLLPVDGDRPGDTIQKNIFSLVPRRYGDCSVASKPARAVAVVVPGGRAGPPPEYCMKGTL